MPEQGAKSVDVARHDGHSDIPLESVDTMVGAAIEAMNLQPVDGGFHRRVLATQFNKLGIALSLLVRLREPSFFRHHDGIDQLG